MSNYLAMETPKANLSKGMQYLQSVFSNRFKKSAEWKLALGAWVKSRSAVPNHRLAERLNLGNSQNASKQMREYLIKYLKTQPSLTPAAFFRRRRDRARALRAGRDNDEIAVETD